MGFIITILIIVVVWRLLRLFFPFILMALVRRQQKRWGAQGGAQGGNPFSGQFGGNSYSQQNSRANSSSNKKDGDVKIRVEGAQEKQVSKNVGETVDFEEIKD